MEWSNIHISLLFDFLREGISISTLAETFGRSRSAVINASRKIMFQHLLHHPIEDVAAMYGYSSVDDFRTAFASEKYYVKPETEPPKAKEADRVPTSIWLVLGLLFTAGVARFGMVLSHSPLLA